MAQALLISREWATQESCFSISDKDFSIVVKSEMKKIFEISENKNTTIIVMFVYLPKVFFVKM